MSTSELFEFNTRVVLAREYLDPIATMEFMPQREGVFCGLRDVNTWLRGLGGHGFQVWTLDEGALFKVGEVALRLRGHFLEYGAHVDGIAGILATQSGWATAARAFVNEAEPQPVILTPSNLIPMEFAAQLDYAAQVGGCAASDSLLGKGVLSRALILLMGDTLRALRAFDQTAPADAPRLALVDTFHNAIDEAVRVALGLGDQLAGVVVQVNHELGAEFLRQMRAQLDLAGFPRVKIFVCGDITLARIALWKKEHAPLDGYFIGNTIANAPPLPFAAELKESDGKPLARRGLAPGTTSSPRLKRMDVE